METKGFNLKKQLAFISSLALIAGTAVYMPANVGQMLGVGQTISVSAQVDTEITNSDIGGVLSSLQYKIGSGALENITTSGVSSGNINVTLDGITTDDISIEATAKTNTSKLFVANDNEFADTATAYSVSEVTPAKLVFDAENKSCKYTAEITINKSTYTATKSEAGVFKTLVNAGGTSVEFDATNPAHIKALDDNSKLTDEKVVNKVADINKTFSVTFTYTEADVDSINTYDETKALTYSINGGEAVAINGGSVVDVADSSANDETVTYENAISLPANTPAGAEIKIQVTPNGTAYSDNNTITLTLGEDGKAKMADTDGIVITGDNVLFNEAGNMIYGDRETIKGINFAVKPSTYSSVNSSTLTKSTSTGSVSALADGESINEMGVVKKVTYNGNDVYATVIEAIVASSTAPTEQLTWAIKPTTNWTASKSSTSFSLGDDAEAESEVIALTKGSTTEYYILSVKKDGAKIAGDSAVQYNIGGTSTSQKIEMTNLYAVEDTYRTSTKTTKVVDGHFVTVYTVAHDDTTATKAYVTGGYDNKDTTPHADTDAVKLVNGNGTTGPYDFNGSGEWVEVVFTTTYDVQLLSTEEVNGKNVELGKVTVKDKKYDTITTPERAGYTFAGWYDSESNANTNNGTTGLVINNLGVTLKTKLFAETPTLYAAWKAIDYTVQFDANNGSYNTLPAGYTAYAVDNGKFTVVGKTFISSDSAKPLNEPERTGYEFKGWAKTKTATTVLTDDELKALSNKANDTVTLYAIWEANENPITFMVKPFKDVSETMVANDTTIDGAKSAATTTLKVKTDSAYGKLPTPVLKGYKFNGWYYWDSAISMLR